MVFYIINYYAEKAYYSDLSLLVCINELPCFKTWQKVRRNQNLKHCSNSSNKATSSTVKDS